MVVLLPVVLPARLAAHLVEVRLAVAQLPTLAVALTCSTAVLLASARALETLAAAVQAPDSAPMLSMTCSTEQRTPT